MRLIALAILATTSTFACANEDPNDRFADIRGPWVQCSACHGAQGEGGIGPRLAGQSADGIITKLLMYKRGQAIGMQSPMMYPQAGALTEGQIGTIGVFVQEGFPDK